MYGVSVHVVESPDDGGFYAEVAKHPISGRGRWGGATEEATTVLQSSAEGAVLMAKQLIGDLGWKPTQILSL